MKLLQTFLLGVLVLLSCHARADDGGKFSGTVVDAQGNPVAGATVKFYQYSPNLKPGMADMVVQEQVMSDTRGTFVLSTFKGWGFIVVTNSGFAPAWQAFYYVPTDPLKIILPAAAVIAGVVVDEFGRAVADADVSVASALSQNRDENDQPSFLSGKMASELFSTRTSSGGKFRIDNFPAGAQAIFTVKKPGKAMRPITGSYRYDQLPFSAGQEDVTLTLEPAGTVTGKVVVRGTGQPLAHVGVDLQPAAPSGTFFQRWGAIESAADGTFTISNISAGAYQVVAHFTNDPVADWIADSVPVKVAAGETVPAVLLQAYKGGILQVLVREKNSHEPLAAVVVGVNIGGVTQGSPSGSNGMVAFRLPPGQFNVSANKPDRSFAQSQGTVTEGQTTRVTLDLDAPFTVTGYVKDTAGMPVAGADIVIFPDFSNNGRPVKTDVTGHYQIKWQKPSWAGSSGQRFYLVARQVERKLAALQEVQTTTTSLDVTLKPAMSLTGQVRDAQGKAVSNAVAYVIFHEENTSFGFGRQPVRSDVQGRIQVNAMPLGCRYELQVNAPGYGRSHSEMEAADPKADHYDFAPLVLTAADRKLAGRVLGTNGAPVAGVQIQVYGEDQPGGTRFTDADGRFADIAVCAGPITVSAYMQGLSGQTETVGGDTNVVIRFEAQSQQYRQPESRTLTGTVYDAAGKPAVGASVMVTPSWSMVDSAQTDANGEYSVKWSTQPGMRDAKYFVIARDVQANLAAIEPIDTNKTSVTLRLGPALSVSGTVLDMNGTPLAAARVNLSIMAGNMGGMVGQDRTKINADGTFAISALPMGQIYNVYISLKGYGSGQRTISKTKSQANSIQLTPFKLKLADQLLAGQVLSAKGDPLPGVQVGIYGNGQPNDNQKTDATGHFKFKVCNGPISVNAWLNTGGRFVSGNVAARGGDSNVILKMGAQQQPPRRAAVRETPLVPQPWTWNALAAWPANHKTGSIILLSLQVLVLAGAGGIVFWSARKCRQRKN